MVSAMGRRSRSRDRGADFSHREFYHNSSSSGGFNNRGGTRDYSSYYRNRFGSQSPEEYQNLRLSYISDSIDDGQLRRILEKEFSRYGDMQAKILTHSEYGGGGRIAYVNYAECGSARIAKSRLQERMIELLGPKVKIDPAGIIKDQVGRYVQHSQQQQQQPPHPHSSPGRRQGRNRSFDPMNDILPPAPGPRGRTPRGPPPGRFYDDGFPPRGPPGRRPPDRSRSPLDHAASPRRRHLSPRGLPPPEFVNGGRGGGRTSEHPRYSDSGYSDERPYVDDLHEVGHDRHGGGGGARRNNHTPRDRGGIDIDEDLNECRTLFVGNLDPNVDHRDLRDLFETYGHVEDVDIKSSPDNHRFAFVQFRNLDMARKAKAEEAGRMLRRSRLSIGYAKVKQSKRLWIGGLGRGLSLETLEKELDRFGAIKKIDFLRGENHAYILFDSLDAAVAAYSDMKGYGLCGRKLRVDFASDDISVNGSGMETSASTGPHQGGRGPDASGGGTTGQPTRRYSNDDSSDSSGPEHRNNTTKSGSERTYRNRVRSPSTPNDHSSSSKKARTSAVSSSSVGVNKSAAAAAAAAGAAPTAAGTTRLEPLAQLTRHVTSVDDHLLSSQPLLPQVWSGAFVLKRSAYPILLFHLKGSLSLFNRYARNRAGDACALVVSQRLKLDQPKHDDIPKWIASPDYCFLIAAPWNGASASDVKDLALPADDAGGAMQARSLKLLVKYFKDKDAAGVVNLSSSKQSSGEPSGMLYAFPACKFADALLNQLTHRVDLLRTCSDEVLLLVLIRGGTG